MEQEVALVPSFETEIEQIQLRLDELRRCL
jgi:hypothetical protein